jgi:hypothetical protein
LWGRSCAGVRTASGATAVHILHKRGRTVVGIDHIGSAHDEQRLAPTAATSAAAANELAGLLTEAGFEHLRTEMLDLDPPAAACVLGHVAPADIRPRGVGAFRCGAVRGLPLVTTDLDSSAEDLVARYASRWGIEQAFADARGGGVATTGPAPAGTPGETGTAAARRCRPRPSSCREDRVRPAAGRDDRRPLPRPDGARGRRRRLRRGTPAEIGQGQSERITRPAGVGEQSVCAAVMPHLIQPGAGIARHRAPFVAVHPGARQCGAQLGRTGCGPRRFSAAVTAQTASSR